MKKRINLLTKQVEYKSLEKIFKHLRIYIGVFFIVFLIYFSVIFFLLLRQNIEKQKLISQKAELLTYLADQKEAEAKFIYFDSKYKQIKNFLKNDVNFEPYYKILNDSLKLASPEPELQDLKINEKREFNFDLSFSSVENILVFLKFAENDRFLSNFDALTLSDFNYEQSGKENETSLQLHFKGVFKKIL